MPLDNFAILSGVWARLDAELSQDVYSHVPQDAAYPYVAMAGFTGISDDDKSLDRIEYTMQLHSWDKNVSSFETVMDMMQAIRTALHKQESSITIAGHNVVLARIEFQETIQEGDSGVGGDTYYHGVQRFRIIVETV